MSEMSVIEPNEFAVVSLDVPGPGYLFLTAAAALHLKYEVNHSALQQRKCTRITTYNIITTTRVNLLSHSVGKGVHESLHNQVAGSN